jgi:glycosyltransferase involved in cell wall biosynthesis
MRSTLVIATGSYPFPSAVEASFVEPELAVIAPMFRRCVMIPRNTIGDAAELPVSAAVDRRFGDAWASPIRRRSEIVRGARWATPLLREALPMLAHRTRAAWKRALWGLGYAGSVRRYIENMILQREIDPRDTVLLTYWFDEFTAGALLAKERFPSLAVATRAHGFDVYEERHDPPLILFRSWSIRRVDRVLSVSDRGRQHLADSFPAERERIETARLGVTPHGLRSDRSADGALRVVSCSSVIALKRVPLIASAVAALSQRRIVHWTHFGDGPQMEEVRAAIRAIAPGSSATVAGKVSHRAVLQHYSSQPTDVFVNASTTEGVPMALMEALSFGVPAVVTNVGGNSELVNSNNGAVVSADVSAQQLGAAIESVYRGGESLRTEAISRFRLEIDAEVVHARTARKLLAL